MLIKRFLGGVQRAIMSSKYNVVFVLGGPGAGKGTQCAKIVEKFGYVHLSAGDLLREERSKPGSEFGDLIEGHIKNGTIVPVEITCSLLERAMKEHKPRTINRSMSSVKLEQPLKFNEVLDYQQVAGKTCGLGRHSILALANSEKDCFLIDGFPRNQNNLEGWNKEMGEKVNLKFVLFFNCKLEVCTQRCLDRGAAGSGRSDDNLESLKKRFDTYMNATMPIIEHYEGMGLVRTIDAGKNPEEIFEEVEKLFEE